MPRGKTAQRQPTVEDLTPEQRRIYDAVPDPLKDLFLVQLPPIDPSAGKKTTEQLERWLAVAKQVRADLDERIGRVSALVSIARTGRPIDLKRELKPLAVSRAVFQFQRGGTGSSDGAQERATRARREAAEPRDDPQAPYGRDGDGNAYAPFGVKGNGAPKKAFGRHAARQTEQFREFLGAIPQIASGEVEEAFARFREQK